MMRIVTGVEQPSPADRLRDAGFGVTELNGEGMKGDVRIAFSVVPRKDTRSALRQIHQVNPEAYVTIEETTTPELVARRRRVRP